MKCDNEEDYVSVRKAMLVQGRLCWCEEGCAGVRKVVSVRKAVLV